MKTLVPRSMTAAADLLRQGAGDGEHATLTLELICYPRERTVASYTAYLSDGRGGQHFWRRTSAIAAVDAAIAGEHEQGAPVQPADMAMEEVGSE